MSKCKDSVLFGGDLAFGLESWISSAYCVNRPLVLSSLQALKSPDSSSKILESQIESEKQQACREQTALKNSQILESQSDFIKPAKSKKVDSSTAFFASAKFVDCHALRCKACNDSKNTANKKVDSRGDISLLDKQSAQGRYNATL